MLQSMVLQRVRLDLVNEQQHHLFIYGSGMWDLRSPTRDQPALPALEGKVLTTGPLTKSQKELFWTNSFCFCGENTS